MIHFTLFLRYVLSVTITLVMNYKVTIINQHLLIAYMLGTMLGIMGIQRN